MMHRSHQASELLAGLRELEIGLSVDDFGTGYSSLSYLNQYPLTGVKVDRAFVRGLGEVPRDAAIVRAILELGRGLRLPILAEGVETPAELGFLGAELCQEVQGYWLGRPATIDTFASQTQRDITVGGGMASAAA